VQDGQVRLGLVVIAETHGLPALESALGLEAQCRVRRLLKVQAMAGAQAAWLAHLHNGFVGLVLLFEPDAALVTQTRPGAQLADVLDVASTVHAIVPDD
jgi:hypothetical protein